jgi:hypothetical protein
VHKLKKTNEDLAADLRASEARIHALEMQLTLENQSGANQDHTGAGSVSDFGRLALSAGSIREHAPLSFAILGGGSAVSPGAASPPPQTGNTGRHDALSREGSHLHLSDILSRDNALKCAQTYFDSNGLAYPFLERTEMIPEMLDVFDTEKERERLDERLSPEMEHADRRKFIVYMMLTIGRSNAVRLGEVSDHCVDKALYSAALRYRAKAVGREDMVSASEPERFKLTPALCAGVVTHDDVFDRDAGDGLAVADAWHGGPRGHGHRAASALGCPGGDCRATPACLLLVLQP